MEPCIATWWISYFPICIAMPLIITEAKTTMKCLNMRIFKIVRIFQNTAQSFIYERFVALGHTHNLKDNPCDNEDTHVH